MGSILTSNIKVDQFTEGGTDGVLSYTLVLPTVLGRACADL